MIYHSSFTYLTFAFCTGVSGISINRWVNTPQFDFTVFGQWWVNPHQFYKKMHGVVGKSPPDLEKLVGKSPPRF